MNRTFGLKDAGYLLSFSNESLIFTSITALINLSPNFLAFGLRSTSFPASLLLTEAYTKPFQTTKMECFSKIVNGYKPFKLF